MSNLQGDLPSEVSNGNVATPETQHEESDYRVVYAIIGGISLAFLLGIILLVVSALADWVD